MDIHSKSPGAAGALSNFYPYRFEFDGVPCASMEGLLQSLLTPDVELQKEICQLVDIVAKKWGIAKLADLGDTGRMWWNGKEYDRHSAEYQNLLDRMYDALAENAEFRATLLSTDDDVLTHSIAQREDASHTILTEDEFCSRLMKIRARRQQPDKA